MNEFFLMLTDVWHPHLQPKCIQYPVKWLKKVI